MPTWVTAAVTPPGPVTGEIGAAITLTAQPSWDPPLASDWQDEGAPAIANEGSGLTRPGGYAGLWDKQKRTQLQVRDRVSYEWSCTPDGTKADSSPYDGSENSVDFYFESAGAKTVTLTVVRERQQRSYSEERWKQDTDLNWPDWDPDATRVAIPGDTIAHRDSCDVSINIQAATATGQVYNPALAPDNKPTTAPDRKYWRMYVPDFNGTDTVTPVPPATTESAPEPVSSYLRLGAVEPRIYDLWVNATVAYETASEVWDIRGGSDPARVVYRANPSFSGQSAFTTFRQSTDRYLKDSGEDLAALVVDFIDDYRYRGNATAKHDNIGGEYAGGKLSTDAASSEWRKRDSVRLHTRGGWRDHTDGNRITTTRGDKVEVIQGNYKMVVLGRKQFKQEQWEARNHSGDTVHRSGGLGQDIDQTPVAVTSIGWHDGLKRWKVDEWGRDGFYTSDTSGYSKTTFSGRQDSYTHGATYSYHGPKPVDSDFNAWFTPFGGLNSEWPADPGKPSDIETASEETDQRAIDVMKGTVESYHEGDLHERRRSDVASSMEFTKQKFSREHTTVEEWVNTWGAKGGVDVGGISAELEIAAVNLALKLVVETLDIAIGNTVTMKIGATQNLRLGPEMNICTSASQDFSYDATTISVKDTLLSTLSTVLCFQYKIN